MRPWTRVLSMRPARSDVARAARVLATRAIESSIVVGALVSLVFFALRLLPGDPARLILGDEASESDLARVRAALHLDESRLAQYARFLLGLSALDLGDSYRRPGTSAMARVGEALVPTAQLATVSVVLGAAIGIAAPVVASGPWLAPPGRPACGGVPGGALPS